MCNDVKEHFYLKFGSRSELLADVAPLVERNVVQQVQVALQRNAIGDFRSVGDTMHEFVALIPCCILLGSAARICA